MESNIYIIGEIGVDYTFNHALADYQRAKQSDVINLHINSPGGYMDEGIQIQQLFKNSGKIIRTYAMGDVASIAVNIYLSTSKENRFYYKGKSRLLIHYPWVEVSGNADELETFTEDLRTEENKLVKELSKELQVDEAVLRGYMQQERFLTDEEVELLNIATIIKQEFKAVAKLKIENMTEKEVKEELSGIKKMLEGIKSLFKPKALMIQDVNGVELDMPEIETIEQLSTGLTVTADGSPANGDYVLDDGTTLKCENGTLTEIVPAGGGDEMEALKAENESLKKQLEELTSNAKAKDEEIKQLQVNAKVKIEEVEKKFNEFKSQYSKEFIPAGEYEDGKKVEIRKPFKNK